jgi:exodeoxyribonuclease I
LRTNFNLEILPEQDCCSVYCKPPPDYLPDPTACLITGITPQFALQNGLPEPEFAARIHREFAQPGTVSAGYNSMRFDEEFTRQLLWRNGFEPYEREYANGNARFDLIDVMRMTYALRPAGMHWPIVDGKPSFKLELLAKANALEHTKAHDALSDVHATLHLARQQKAAQPKLWAHAFALRHKNVAASFLDYANAVPVVHVSQRFSAERGCLALVMPLALHPGRSGQVIVYDLMSDPSGLIELDAEAIAERLYLKQVDLPESEARVPLKLVHLNRCPMLAPLSVLKGVDTARVKLDVALCLNHAEQIKMGLAKLQQKVRAVYALEPPFPAANPQADWPRQNPSLYDGFAPPKDRAQLKALLQNPPKHWPVSLPEFIDPRIKPLLQLYRARHFPETLNPAEQAHWHSMRIAKLQFGERNFTRFFSEINQLRIGAESIEKLSVLDELQAYGMGLQRELGI